MGKYEEPHFDIKLEEGNYQIREYEPFVTAMTKDHTLRGSGFGKLFSFISGENTTQEKLAMTIPVINDAKESTMEFVLPLKYQSVEEAPVPTNPHVTLKAYPKALVAVFRFSGKAGSDSIEKNLTQLKEWVINKGFKIVSEYRLARYNAPLTPGFLRRNEILLTVEEKI
jgi:hypothetical protein